MHKRIIELLIASLILPLVVEFVKDRIKPPFDPGAIALALAIVVSAALLLIWLNREDKNPTLAATSARKDRKSARQPNPLTTKRSSSTVDIPIVAERVSDIWGGVKFALLAAACWSISNILLRLTASKLPIGAGIDIALVNYVVAAVTLLLGGLAAGWSNKRKMVWPRTESPVKFWFVALFKGANTLCWILAVSMISAAATAALENLHVVWTVVFLALFWRGRVPKGAWINIVIGATMLALGTILIIGTKDISSANLLGILLGIVSGLSFSAFYVSWERTGRRPAELWQRSVETGGLLLAASALLFPIYLLVNLLLLHGSTLPFQALRARDIAIQVVCGLIGIGATYWFVNEALHRLEGHRLASLVLGVGLAYSVPMTMLLEIGFLGLETVLEQWIGAALFFVGSVAILIERSNSRVEDGRIKGSIRAA